MKPKQRHVFIILIEQWMLNNLMLSESVLSMIGHSSDSYSAKFMAEDTSKRTGLRCFVAKVPIMYDSHGSEEEILSKPKQTIITSAKAKRR